MKNTARNELLRNVAIIAHVDHGKTTLVDGLFRQSGVFRENQQVSDRVMDNMDLERERGITIAAKNCSVTWKGVKINIIDTPGHADFGGEVERSLAMAGGAILLVDASEGPLPQTRFVLKKALDGGLPVIVIVNKIDRGDARPEEVLNEVYDLFIDLGADEHQLEFPVLYAIGRDGIAQTTLEGRGENLHPVFDCILENIPAPAFDPDAPFQMIVCDLGYSDYLGRLAIGKVVNGVVKSSDSMVCIGEDGAPKTLKVSKLQVYDGVQLAAVDEVKAGDIAVLAGIDDVHIGDTICTKESPVALPRITVDEPTVSMRFGINTSPLAGREGKLVQSNKIRERLMKEALQNVAIRIEESDDRDSFIVKGRGEFQMAIIIETMRREGFELCVSKMVVITHEENGVTVEPVELLMLDCPPEFQGAVMNGLGARGAQLKNMVIGEDGRVRFEYIISSKALIGLKSEFMTFTKGSGLMHHSFHGFLPEGNFKQPVRNGVFIAKDAGLSSGYALNSLQDHGIMCVGPGQDIYSGQIVGEHCRSNDLVVNPCKEKQQSNMRSSNADASICLTPYRKMSLEQAIEYVEEDEFVEVTPKSLRLRKKILDHSKRKRGEKVED